MFAPYTEEEKLIDHYVMADEEKISSGKEIENDENQIRELIRGYWNDEGSYAYLDPEDELLLFDLGGIEKREYDMKQIVHEAYGEHEANWYLIYVNREDENDTVCITMDQGTLYLEDLNGNTFFGKLN